MRRAGIVFAKEVVDNLRDRRSLMAALFYPILGPSLLVVVLMLVGRTFRDRAETNIELPVVGAANAPNLVDYLGTYGLDVVDGPVDPEAAVAAGDVDVVLVVPDDYAEAFTAGRPAPLQLVQDASRNTAAVSVGRVQRALESYSRRMAALRLMARGVNPAVVDALAVERVDVATPQSQAANLLNLMPYFVVFAIFVGGMYLAIDATAGERDRGSLEPLLTNPVARWELVAGKMGATLLFTLISLVETLLAFAVLFNVVPLGDSLGIRLSLGFGTFATIFFITVPMVLLAVPLQLLIAASTRSFKEAQNYLSMLPLVPALPGMFLAFLPVKPALWAMLIPTFGQQILINQVMRGEAVSALHVAVATAVTVVLGLALTTLVVKLFERERILFGR